MSSLLAADADMEWTPWLLAIVGVLVAFYWYLTRTHKYWQDRGVPGPRPLPFFGTYFGQFFTPFQESELKRFEKYGSIYGIFDGTEPGLIVGDPDLIRNIMVKDFHIFTNRRGVKTTHPVMSKFLSSLEIEEWKRVRAITTPTFTSRKLKNIYHHMEEAADTMMATLRTLSDGDREMDLKRLYGGYTMDVIARSAFATQADAVFVEQASRLFTFPFWRKFLDVVPMNVLDPLKFTVLPPGAMAFFRSVTLKVIRERRANGAQHADFLQLLISARNPASGADISEAINDIAEATSNQISPEERRVNENALNGSHGLFTSKRLEEDEIVAQSVLFFSVGFETSSQLLTYASYCLALNEDCQERLYQEIVAALGEKGEDREGVISYESLPKLEYLEAVINETLRLYNPVLRMERKASSDYKLGDTGLTIPKGMIVGIPVWALHHSALFYPQPEQFIPNRFLPQNKDQIQPYSFLPFGAGSRNCIGTRFALLEVKLVLVEILLKYRFVRSARTPVPLPFYPCGRPLLCSGQVFLRIQKRD